MEKNGQRYEVPEKNVKELLDHKLIKEEYNDKLGIVVYKLTKKGWDYVKQSRKIH